MQALSRPLLYALLGGLAGFFSLIATYLWPLSFISVAAYFLSVRTAGSWKKAALLGLFFGLIVSFGGVWWFQHTVPLSWIAVPEGPVQYYLVAVVQGLTALSLALPFVLLAPFIHRVPSRAWYLPFALVLAYLLIEELRPWFFALFFLSPESMLAPDFSIAALGYTLTEFSLLLPIAQAGLPGLTLFLGVTGTLFFFAVSYRENRKIIAACAVVLVVMVFVSHLTLPTISMTNTVRVALLGTTVPPGPFVNPIQVLMLLERAATEAPSIIAVPEGLGIQPFFPKEERVRRYASLFKEREGLVISSSVVKDASGDERAELQYESSIHGVVGTQDKIFFVPVGEYFPPLIQVAISLAGKENLNGYGNYIAGRPIKGERLSPNTFNDFTIGALMCSEMLSTRLYHELATSHKTDVLLNIANNSWFHGSRLLHERLKQLAKVHALQERQFMLVASNGSPAYAIDSRGNLIGESAWDIPEVLIVDVPLP
jgi:apolipoprotein N-acyltransferase